MDTESANAVVFAVMFSCGALYGLLLVHMLVQAVKR